MELGAERGMERELELGIECGVECGMERGTDVNVISPISKVGVNVGVVVADTWQSSHESD